MLIALTILATSSALFLSAQALQPVGTWAPSGAVADGRSGAASVALRDGTTLIVGGVLDGSASGTVLRFDPAAGTLITAGQLLSARIGHTATQLDDGRVLVAGGRAGDAPALDLEVFDPDSGTSTVLGQLSQPRIGHASARIADGLVVIFGGATAEGAVLDTVERIDVATGSVSAGANRMVSPRANASATALIDGRVLIAGGNDGNADLRSAEVYYPWTQTFEATVNELSAPRSSHTAVLLPHNGGVLIAGGNSNGPAQSSVDLFLPAESPDPFSFGVHTFVPTGTMAAARAGATGGAGREGFVWVDGGGSTESESYRFATIKTDKDDYAPGERAVITGSGWMPGEDVRLLFQEDPSVHADYELVVRADAAGNIYWDQWAPEEHDLGVRFYLLASDSRSRAQITFTDSNIRNDLALNPNSVTVTAGQTAVYTLTVNFGGNTDPCTATLSVSGLPTGAAASFSPASVTGAVNDTPKTSTLTVTTTATGSNATPTGAHTLTVTANRAADCDGSSRSVTGTLIVNGNNAPVAASQSVTTNEDNALTITLSSSDANGDSQTFAIVAGPTQGTLGSIGAVSCSGTSPRTCTADVTYTPAADYNGSDSFTFRSNDGTVNSAIATVNITVNSVNDAPTFTAGGDVTVNEDSAAYSQAWATAINAGPANESGQAVSFVVTNDNNALFSAQPAVSAAGLLTFTPASNAFGAATVTIYAQDTGGTANGGDDTSNAQTLTITVNAVNDPPSFTKGADATVNEDSGAHTSAGWATGISAGPANESSQTVSFVVSNNNPSLFSVQPAVDGTTGTLTFTPAANAFGSASVTIYAQDNGGTANGGNDTSGSQTFTVTINAVNDPPTFTAGGNVMVNEDSGAHSQAWASNISAGPTNESGQTVSFVVSNNNNALFSVQPAVSPTGVLTFTPAANAFGLATITIDAQDNGGIANGGDDTSDSQTFTIMINAVNDAPSFTKGADVTVNEDSGAHTTAGWATGISAGPANESTQTVSFVVSNNNPSLFSAQPAVSPAGALTFTPAANAFGTATVTIRLQDDGGTTNGGDDTSDDQTFTITVSAVNDAPSFVSGGNVTVNEDSGAYSAGWATAITAGPNESTQTVSFVVSNTNPSLFSAQPAVSSTGVLTFTPATNAFGSATVTVYAQDNGGTANSGDDTSDPQTFVIAVSPVNDPPALGSVSLSDSDAIISENDPVLLIGAFTDVEPGDSHTVTIAWGDGSPNTVQLLGAGVLTFSASHTYLDDNPTATAFDLNAIVITIADDASTTGGPGASVSGATGITVNNLAPVIASLSEPGAPIQLGGTAEITANFTDVGTLDTHSCKFEWDDGTTSQTTGTVVVDQTGDTCKGTKEYSSAGVYTVKVTVTDDDTGATSTDYKYVVVYDPSAGFVTGGGWLISPIIPGMQYMSESGKASFGFVSKYQKGAKVPTGETQFQFQAGNLNFHSIAYDWLVIASAKAQYKGVGRINNALAPNGLPYKFLLTATDGQINGGGGVDRFRIKIWWEDGGVATIVYDNSPSSDDIDQTVTQAIGGGSIVIHSK